MVKQPELPPGWRVIGPSGETVQQAEGPTAAELNAVSDAEKGGDDGSDRAAPGE